MANRKKSPRNKPEPTSAPPSGWRLDSNVIWGLLLLIVGWSGAFVIQGTDSSLALIIVGAALLVWGIHQTIRPSPKRKPAAQPTGIRDNTRETVESLVVAFILAFLFRTFEAEAFVIPTGSMAPTLFGRHKDVTCEECGHHFSVGASDEVDPVDGTLENRLITARCPNCRFENNVYDLPVFTGDRIIVTKLYEEPDRFDVIVFKYPEKPYVNYIKRLVGLPGEEVKIEFGDVKTRRDYGDRWEIARKSDPDKQQRIQLLVYDDALPASALLKAGWPERWEAVRPDNREGAIGGWIKEDDGFKRDKSRKYSVGAAATSDFRWLRYRHLIPSQDDWARARAAKGGQVDFQPQSRLIADYCGYNAYQVERVVSAGPDYGIYWVGDLTLECEVEIKDVQQGSTLKIELIEGQHSYQASIDPNSGQAKLIRITRSENEEFEETLATANTDLQGTGEYSLRFANVDDRLCLWIDDSIVDFGEGALVDTFSSHIPTDSDLCPAGVGVRGMDATVSELKLYRDIYYRDEVLDDSGGIYGAHPISEIGSQEARLQSLLTSPAAWHRCYVENRANRDAQLGTSGTYKLREDEFLMLGDNSPRSRDSRLFPSERRLRRDVDFQRFAVPRDAIIGKAFFVYWPHGIPFLNNGKGYPVSYHTDRQGAKQEYPTHQMPFYPNVPRMRRIR